MTDAFSAMREQARALDAEIESLRAQVGEANALAATMAAEASRLRVERDGARRSEAEAAALLDDAIFHLNNATRLANTEGDRRKAAEARAEAAEAALAALREAADRIAAIAVIPYDDKGNAATAAYNDAIRNTDAAARRSLARVRREALQEAADRMERRAIDGDVWAHSVVAALLAMADER